MTNHRYFGEISILSADGKKFATLPCELSGETDISVIFYDDNGSFCRRKRFRLKKGYFNLRLSATDLEAGHYCAWIEANGKTYLRGFQIEDEQQKSIFSKVRQLLQLREVS